MRKTAQPIRHTLTSFHVLLQIYNEMIRDLLNPASGYLELREDSRGVCTVAGLTEVSARSTEEVSATRYKLQKKSRSSLVVSKTLTAFKHISSSIIYYRTQYLTVLTLFLVLQLLNVVLFNGSYS